NMMLDMKLTTTYNPKTATSSQANAITATAGTSVSNGSYDSEVKELATRAMNVGRSLEGVDINTKMTAGPAEGFSFTTYDKSGQAQEHILTVKEGETLGQVLKNIEKASDDQVRAFFDESKNRVVLEASRTGSYNESGKEITFAGNEFFTEFLGLDEANETGGTNAKFTYNNSLDIVSRDNTYTLNGMTFDFHNVTEGNARISVQTDVDQSFDKMMDFVNKYNELIDAMNKSQTEERFRDYLPLSEEQKADMTDKQIELWEEKAKSGMLRGEATIRNGMYELRGSLQAQVSNEGAYSVLSSIGITTTAIYLDGRKLEVDENKLKASLLENPDDVYNLFVNSSKGEERGLIHPFDDALDSVRGKIEQQAGKTSQTLDNYALGKQMKANNDRIADFERRMIQVEQRYWTQFTQMEKAIARLQDQSNNLLSQLGGM